MGIWKGALARIPANSRERKNAHPLDDQKKYLHRTPPGAWPQVRLTDRVTQSAAASMGAREVLGWRSKARLDGVHLPMHPHKPASPALDREWTVCSRSPPLRAQSCLDEGTQY